MDGTFKIFFTAESSTRQQKSQHLSSQLDIARHLSEVLNRRRAAMTWQPHIKNQSSFDLFWFQTSPPLFSLHPLRSPFLCCSLPHPSLSRTTGACLLSSQCFYSLALAQGSIQSGPCIQSGSPIIHMLTLERAAFSAARETTLIEPRQFRWPFCSFY